MQRIPAFRSHGFCRLALAFLAIIALGFALAPRAHAGPGPSSESMTQAVTQSDGICSRVVDDLWENTDHYWHEGDYNRDIALIRVIVSIDPSFVDAYSAGAWLIWSMGDSANADAFLQDGVKNSPAHAEIEYEFGWQLFNTKRYPEAIAYFKRSIEHGSTDHRAYALLAHAYRIQGNYDASIAVWKTIVKKFPDYPAAAVNLARVVALKKSGTTAPMHSAPKAK